ncbi:MULTISPECIES: dTDP-4-dehydrorhamnose 3,5-epimerase [Comamonas]|uniref:dTDP-4-dehydrorhamnose 3,5-epimerase n=1 Tax=Comamonas testosteroni TaxID=285 RepID=A0A096F9G4_COMTE|nr:MULTISPECIES: dTDP-4-dehydrorhamnose 3,5-epimerase [Comamonas]KGH26564.1 dTDP-4-dehydrorhamnose 3,5-epimerase [Comamonas testosteroni]MPT10535.1 dTDP-4-dehydrorhamnose 3,5-epimerase [Comamonas sp.]
MKVVPTAIPEIKLFKPTIHRDGRGLFVESFRQDLFNQATGTNYEFVQDNHSRSSKGVLRGLHYQLPPHAQGKLVRVISGAVFDVAVDIRRSSPTFGQWVGAELSAENHHQLWIPPGFAHGFVVLSDTADLVYKTTAYYAPESDRGLLWSDPDIAIAWPQLDIAFSLSEKDLHQPAFKQAELFD